MGRAHAETRRMKKLRTEFFEQGRRLAAAGDPTADCWLCGMPIDYTVPANTTPDSHNLDHYYPVSDYPERQEDPTGFRHSHQVCNVTRGKRAPAPGLGTIVPDWW